MVLPIFKVLETECAHALMEFERPDMAGREKVSLKCGETMELRAYDLVVRAWAANCLAHVGDTLEDAMHVINFYVLPFVKPK